MKTTSYVGVSSRTFYLFICCLAVCTYSAFGQTFTKVTTGPIVKDRGNSFYSSWNDYNNDGYLDLFITNYVGENNFLYKNNGDGSFTKITDGIIVNDNGNSISGSWGDYDNDGHLDLFVTNRDLNNNLYHNDDNETFSKITDGDMVNDKGSSLGCSWGDYDNDGYLDMFVTNFGQNNCLYHNNGNGTFSKITAGAIVNDDGNSTSCGWCDFDNDGDLDLFVTNWGEPNFLYRNNGNREFSRVTTIDFSRDTGNSLGCSWSDYDNDGDFDLIVINSFQDNFLYQNNGNGTFTKITTSPIVKNTDFSCSSNWTDVDNDGDLDLFITNWDDAPSSLFINNGYGLFDKLTIGTIVKEEKHSVGCSWGDVDNDGDLDLAVANDGGQNNLVYINNGNGNNWINIKCIGITSNASAIGTTVKARATINNIAVKQIQYIAGQTGFASQNSLNVEFGLGNANIIDTLQLKWPSGVNQVLTNVAVNQFLTIYEPTTFLSIPELTSNPANNVLVPVNVQFPDNFSFNSAEIEIGGYYGKLDLLGIFTDSSIVGDANWIYESNEKDSTVLIWFAGAQEIAGSGILFYLQFYVPDIQAEFVPITIESAAFNTGEVPIKTTQGGINIQRNNIDSDPVAIERRNPVIIPTNSLSFNYPNPFNPRTTINYALENGGNVRLLIFNEMGNLVRNLVNAEQPAGQFSAVWNGLNDNGDRVASGLYFYTLIVDQKTIFTQRMTLIK